MLYSILHRFLPSCLWGWLNMNMTNLKLFQNSTWKKWELLEAALVTWLPASHLDLAGLRSQTSAKPLAASMAWTHLISEGSYDFHLLLNPKEHLLQHKHFETLLNQSYLSDFKYLVEEGEKRKCVHQSYAFYKMGTYIVIRRHFHFLWLFISLDHSAEIF